MNNSYENLIESVNITKSFIDDLRLKLKEYDDELQILITNILQSVEDLQINNDKLNELSDKSNDLNVYRLDAIEQEISHLKELITSIRLNQLPKVIVPKISTKNERPLNAV